MYYCPLLPAKLKHRASRNKFNWNCHLQGQGFGPRGAREVWGVAGGRQAEEGAGKEKRGEGGGVDK